MTFISYENLRNFAKILKLKIESYDFLRKIGTFCESYDFLRNQKLNLTKFKIYILRKFDALLITHCVYSLPIVARFQ